VSKEEEWGDHPERKGGGGGRRLFRGGKKERARFLKIGRGGKPRELNLGKRFKDGGRG